MFDQTILTMNIIYIYIAHKKKHIKFNKQIIRVHIITCNDLSEVGLHIDRFSSILKFIDYGFIDILNYYRIIKIFAYRLSV